MLPERWQQVKKILDGALEQSPNSRGAFLKTVCAGDTELRREVESFLEFEDAEADFIGDSVFESTENLFETTADVFIGKNLGNYKIIAELGAGGMGTVFLAGRIDGEFTQNVAVKLIKHNINSDVIRRRFYRERQILAGLEHPNIARLIDGGTTTDGLPFLVMEYVEGLPITDYAAKNNLTLTERLDLFREICAAVSYAHQNLIVHRDLKPSNILVAKDGSPKLLDFGIAKLLNDECTGETQTHTFVFTPEYASPEQLRGENLTTVTDIYSLGVILYELLTGSRPFAFDGKNFGEIIITVSQTEPSRPSSVVRRPSLVDTSKTTQTKKPQTTGDRRRTKSLKGDLDNIILKALKRDSERRYSSVEQFSEDIRRHLKGLPVTARQDTLLYRAEKFTKRNPLVVSTIALAFLILIGGILATVYQARLANVEREKAERRFNDVRTLANSFMFEVNEQITRSPIKARELLVTRALEYLDKLAQEAEGDTNLQSELATAYEKIGEVQSEIFNPSLGRAADALESHRKSFVIRETLFAANPNNLQFGLDLAKSRNRIGDVLTTTGKQAEAVESYRESVLLSERLLELKPKNIFVQRGLSSSYAKLGQAILRSGALSDALKNYEKALKIQKNLTAENPDDLQLEHGVSVYSSYIGYVKLEMGEFDKALHYFQNSLEIDEQILRTNETNKQFQSAVNSSNIWVAVALHELGKTDESLAHLQKALKIQQAIYDTDKSNFGEQNALADCFLELGLVLKKAGRFDEAIEIYEKAIENYESVSNADAQNLAARRQIFFTRKRLAGALFQKGETEKALENYEKSLAAFKELTVSDPNNTEWQHDLALCHLKIGEVFLKKNDQRKALGNFETALPILEKLVAESIENVSRRRDLEIVRKHLESLKR